MLRIEPAFAILLAASLGSFGRAQDTLFTFEGAHAGDELGSGWGIAPLGDVDGDGVPDLLVGTRKFDGISGADCGMAAVVSGRTRSVLWCHEGENHDDWFGFTVEDALDVDGDAIHDALVTSFGYPAGARAGKVYLYSGASGALIRSWSGENVNDRFMYTRGVGDATGDGVNDILVTAFQFAPAANGLGSGKAYLYSGADGSLVNSWLGDSGSNFGYRLGRLLFDVDGDGATDFAIGSFEQGTTPPGPGHVYVYSGKSQIPLVTIAGANNGDYQGYTNDAADVDGDGTPDLLVSSPFVSGGVMYLYSGADWSVLRTWTGDATLPIEPGAIVGDVDGDGFAEVVAGLSNYDGPAGTDSGILRMFSGATGRELTRWYGEQAYGQLPGNSAIGAGDLDGDGIPDLLASAFTFDGAAGVDCGKVYAFQGNDLYLNVEPSTANAGDTVTLTTTAGKPGNFVIDVVTAIDGAPMFLLLTPVLAFDANGELVISGDVPPGLGPHDVELQSYAVGRRGKLIDSSVRTLSLQ
jgi:hypothetical protein